MNFKTRPIDFDSDLEPFARLTNEYFRENVPPKDIQHEVESLPLTGPRGTLVGLPGNLLLSGPCCLAGARGASRQVPWSALVGLPGKLLLPGPCLLSLNTLFLNGSKGTTEDLGVLPASLAAGCCSCPCTSSGY